MSLGIRIAIATSVLLIASMAIGADCFGAAFVSEEQRPNILWLSTEDIGPHLACYGDATAPTPNLDAFAKRSMVCDVAWSNYPVCAPARTTIISGAYASAYGAGNMRSMARLPDGLKMFPQHLREAGYYCTNRSKEDYNLHQPGQVWDQSNKKATWTDPKRRGTDAKGNPKPFFAVFNEFRTHESKIRVRPHEAIVDPASVSLPPYWPDVPEFRQDFAQYYDNLITLDKWFGQRLRELEDSGEADNTIVIFFGDHGGGMPRHKRYAGDSGMKVPFIVHVPEKLKAKYAPSEYESGGRTSRPIGFVDLAPSMLSVLGIKPPAHMQGHAFLGPHQAEPPKYVYGFRDRMDERPDFSRSIRDERFIYVRNFFPHVPAGQFIDYQQQTPCTAKWLQMFNAGELNDVQAHFWENHPPEELYDLKSDPHETVNLVDDPTHVETLTRFQNELLDNTIRTGDLGFVHEGRLQEITVAGKQTRRSLAQDKESLPLKKIFNVANLIGVETDAAKFVEATKSDNPTIRYWAAMGLLNSDPSTLKEQVSTVDQLVRDEAIEVSLTAAEVSIAHQLGDTKLAEKVIARFSNLSEGNQFYAVTALNIAGRHRNQLDDSCIEKIKLVPTKDPLVDRGGEYVAQLIQTMFGEDQSNK
jgi:uncharacterized sulfatase